MGSHGGRWVPTRDPPSCFPTCMSSTSPSWTSTRTEWGCRPPGKRASGSRWTTGSRARGRGRSCGGQSRPTTCSSPRGQSRTGSVGATLKWTTCSRRTRSTSSTWRRTRVFATLRPGASPLRRGRGPGAGWANMLAHRFRIDNKRSRNQERPGEFR